MTSGTDFPVYCPVPTNPNATEQNLVVLTLYQPPSHPRRSRRLRLCLISAAIILLVSAAVFLLFPADPYIQLARVKLNHIRIHKSYKLVIDLSFSLTIKVHNRDFFSLYYDSLVVSVGYRGRELGFVNSEGGRVRARASTYVNATLDLNGFEVIHDVFHLLEDLAKGVIPFDTESEVQGKLGLLFFNIPIKVRVSCEVYVNTKNQTISHQDCYPE